MHWSTSRAPERSTTRVAPCQGYGDSLPNSQFLASVLPWTTILSAIETLARCFHLSRPRRPDADSPPGEVLISVFYGARHFDATQDPSANSEPGRADPGVLPPSMDGVGSHWSQLR